MLPELNGKPVQIYQNEPYPLDYLVVAFTFRDKFDYRTGSSGAISFHSAIANPVFISGGTKH